jgi:hypothetical protein
VDLGTRTRTFLAAGLLVGAPLLLTAALSILSVTLVVKPDRQSYPVGGSFHVELFLTYGPNFVKGPVTVPSIDYEITVSSSKGPVLAVRRYIETREPPKAFPNTTLKIGEWSWDLRDLSGHTVPPGIYRITVRFLDYPLSGEAAIQVY